MMDELRDIFGPQMLELPPLKDAEAVRYLTELKALPHPTSAQLQFIAELEAAWHRAAQADMRR